MGGRQRGNIGSASVRFISASPRGEKVARTDAPAKWVSSERSRSPGRARVGPAVVGLAPVSPRGEKAVGTELPAKWMSTDAIGAPAKPVLIPRMLLFPDCQRAEKVLPTEVEKS